MALSIIRMIKQNLFTSADEDRSYLIIIIIMNVAVKPIVHYSV